MRNRSVPNASVIPEIAYPDVGEAAEWLSRAFGFRKRLQIGNHRFQPSFGNGALVVVELPADATVDSGTRSVLVLVDNVDAACERAIAGGAEVIHPPEDQPYGERQFSVRDFAGYRWTFSQSIADVDPADWGGTAIDLTGD
jgi:uncharacterized glyoxalase superfamily protein PhnB